MNHLVDLSHTLEHGMETYPGMPTPMLSDHLSRSDSRQHYAENASFQIGRIDMVANTSTYIDAPFHRFEKGADLSELDLGQVANVAGVKFTVTNRRVTVEDLMGNLTGKAVLIETGWDIKWRTAAYFENNPFLTKEAAQFLVDQRVAIVGIDSVNIDDMQDRARPAHTLLLAADIPIVEHMCGLSKLPPQGWRFFAVPVKVKGMGSFPVRSFAVLDD